jgi:hypothetical protein
MADRPLQLLVSRLAQRQKDQARPPHALLRLEMREALSSFMQLTSLVIPPIDRLTELFSRRKKHETISRPVFTDSYCLCGEPSPTTCDVSFIQEVVGGPTDTLAIAVIEHGVKLPSIPSSLNLAAVILEEALHKRFRQSAPEQVLGTFDEASIDWEWHVAIRRG